LNDRPAASGNRVSVFGHRQVVRAVERVNREASGALSELERFADLYDAFADTVYNHCFRRTGSWALAEDLVAVTFLEAWRRRAALPGDAGGALPWLLAIANNVLRNVRRSQRRHAAALARLPTPEPASDPSDAAAARIDAEREIAKLLPVLRALPRREREVVELCAGCGLSHQEAARALGIPAGTVKSRLSRGLTRIRALSAGALDYTGSTHNEVKER
jgi:RNA polymerase sigma factor (sigma-70 family)